MRGPEPTPPEPLASLDAVRAAVLRRTGRALAPFIRDRDDRIVASFALAATFATALTLALPSLPLFLAPLVLGVPHLVADVRYLVVRRGLASRAAVVLGVCAPCLLALAASPTLAAAIALFGAAIVARGSFVRRSLVGLAALGLGYVARVHGSVVDAAFAHGHHLVALAVFGLIAPRRATTLPLLLLVASVATAALVALFDADRFALFGDMTALAPLAATLAPGAAARTGALVLAVYAMHQSLHYAIWLRLVPDAVAERSAPRTFAASHRSLVKELGSAALVTAVVATLGFVAFAAVASPLASREAYLRLALFHGPLEVGLLGLAFAEARRP